MLQAIPIDVYKEIIFKLEPGAFIDACYSNKYAINICDNNFVKTYIIYNFDPLNYNFNEWNDDILAKFNYIKWIYFLNLIVSGKNIHASINNKRYELNIQYLDKSYEIINKIIDMLNSLNIEINNFTAYIRDINNINILILQSSQIYVTYVSYNKKINIDIFIPVGYIEFNNHRIFNDFDNILVEYR
jgi:hypothetical protein